MNDEELRASRARIVASIHAGRRRIERTLHDGPQQHLVAMAVKLRLAESAIDDDPAGAKVQLAEIRADVQDTIQHLRDLAYEIYPPLLADRGLGEALSAAAGRADVDVDLAVADRNRRYPPEVEAAIYFCVLDAIRAATGPVAVEIREEADELVVELRGPFDPDASAMLDIADRTDTLGGAVTIEHLDDGSHLRATVPLDR